MRIFHLPLGVHVTSLLSQQAVNPVLWMLVEANYALIACSVFCLRPFMAAVHTNCGVASGSNLERTHTLQQRRQGLPRTEPEAGTRNSGPLSPPQLPGPLQTILQNSTNENQGEKRKESRWFPWVRETVNGDSNSMSIDVVSPSATMVTGGRSGNGNGGGTDGNKEDAKMRIQKDIGYSIEYTKTSLSTKDAIGTGSWHTYFRGYCD